MHPLRSTLFCLVLLVAAPATALDYQNDILPIMKDHCWKCHSNEEEAKGDIAFDDLKAMAEIHVADIGMIRPGNPEKSDFLARMKLDEEEDDFMPKNGKALRAGELAKIEQWIKEGALIDAKNPTAAETARMEAAKTAVAADAYLSWTNLQGKVIEAKFVGLEGEAVKITMKNGKSFAVPLSGLSPESAALAKKLGGQ
jgi:Planctomycete cytochrome C